MKLRKAAEIRYLKKEIEELRAQLEAKAEAEHDTWVQYYKEEREIAHGSFVRLYDLIESAPDLNWLHEAADRVMRHYQEATGMERYVPPYMREGGNPEYSEQVEQKRQKANGNSADAKDEG